MSYNMAYSNSKVDYCNKSTFKWRFFSFRWRISKFRLRISDQAQSIEIKSLVWSKSKLECLCTLYCSAVKWEL